MTLNKKHSITKLSIAIAAAVFGTAPFSAAYAQESANTRNFQVDAGPLNKSILQLAKQAGIEITVDPRKLEGKTARRVSGKLSTREALNALLEGTGLSATPHGQTFRIDVIPQSVANNKTEPVTVRLADIVISGERVDRSLSQTTSSVSVLPTEEIERKTGTESVLQLFRGTPNLTPGTPEELPVIRGERSSGPATLGGGFLFGTTSRASLIVDDVPRITSIHNSSFQSIFDLKQAELFRGPQTTVRGANAIAGAYVITTKTPEFNNSGRVQIGVDDTEFSQLGLRLSAMGNRKLSDELATRVVVETRKGSVPVKVIDASNSDPNGFGFQAPPAGLDLDSLSEFDNTSLRTKFLYLPAHNPDLDLNFSVEAQRGTDVGFDSYVSGPGAIGRPLEERKYQFGDQRIFDTESYAYIFNGGYQLGSGDEIRVIASYQTDDFKNSPLANQATVFKRFFETLGSLDVLYTMAPINGLGGLFGATVSQRTQEGETAGLVLKNDQTYTNMALFADLNYALNDRWSLLGGGRLNQQEVKRAFDFAGLAQVNNDTSEFRFLPKLGVMYTIDPAQTASITYRRGYNPGGSGIDFASRDTFFFESEQADVFELGYRYLPADGKLSMGVTVFYNEFDDKQFQFSPAPNTSRVINQDKSRSYGAELDISSQVSDTLRLSAALGLLNTKIESGNALIEGNKFGEDPSNTITVAALWTPVNKLALNASISQVGQYFTSFQNQPTDRGGDYVVADVGAEYSADAWTFRAFINNLTDELAVSRGTSFGAYLLPPRTIGASVAYDF